MKTPTRYFEVYYNEDQVEGKGRTISTGFAFHNEIEAIRFAQSKLYAKHFGAMGTKGSSLDVKTISVFIFTTCEEASSYFSQIQKEKIKQAALLKLTKEEREALGY